MENLDSLLNGDEFGEDVKLKLFEKIHDSEDEQYDYYKMSAFLDDQNIGVFVYEQIGDNDYLFSYESPKDFIDYLKSDDMGVIVPYKKLLSEYEIKALENDMVLYSVDEINESKLDSFFYDGFVCMILHEGITANLEAKGDVVMFDSERVPLTKDSVENDEDLNNKIESGGDIVNNNWIEIKFYKTDDDSVLTDEDDQEIIEVKHQLDNAIDHAIDVIKNYT